MFVHVHEPMFCRKIGEKGCQMEIRNWYPKKVTKSAHASPRASSNLPFCPCARIRRSHFARFTNQELGTSRHSRFCFPRHGIGLLNWNRIRRELLRISADTLALVTSTPWNLLPALSMKELDMPATSSCYRATYIEKHGGKGIRTPGLLIANETLYQLSYTPLKAGRDS